MLIRFLLEAAYSADARRAYRSTRNGRRRQDGPSERCRSSRTLAGWGVRARVAVGSKPDFRTCVSRMELTIDILTLRLCACRRTTDLTFDRLLGVKAHGMASPLLRRRRTGRMGAIGHIRRGSRGRRPRRHSIDRSKSSVAAIGAVAGHNTPIGHPGAGPTAQPGGSRRPARGPRSALPQFASRVALQPRGLTGVGPGPSRVETASTRRAADGARVRRLAGPLASVRRCRPSLRQSPR